MSYHVPSRVTIKKLFKGDTNYFDRAAAIVERWYKLEGSYFDSIEGFLEDGHDDIEVLADAATSKEDRHIVWMALEGWDPYGDEDEEEEEDEEEDEDYPSDWITLGGYDPYEDEEEDEEEE